MAAAAFDELIYKSIEEIRSICKSYERVYVMFSGGRDSLVVLDLSLRALGRERVEALFIDTGIATPGLKEYVVETCIGYGVKLNIVSPDYDFFKLVELKGFPMIKYRWCKEYLKIKPLKCFVDELKTRGVDFVLVTGLRRDESWFKGKGRKLYDHPVLGVKVYAPIFEWTGDMVREYIKLCGLRENSLYELYGKAYDCWCTAFKSPADFALLAILHPDFFKKFVEAEAKLRSGGSALYYNGRRVYLRDIAKNPDKYLREYPRTFKCPLCRALT
jgi:phosphoadenosine phosphosulfate reductase